MREESQSKNRIPNPPEMAERLLLSLLPKPIRDYVLGDLFEIFNDIIVPRYGFSKARFWYWRQVIFSMRLFFRFNRKKAALGSYKERNQIRKPILNLVTNHPGISIHHVSMGSDIPSFLINLSIVSTFIFGIPDLIGLFVIPVTLGLLSSGIMLYWHNHHALEIRILGLDKLR